MTRSPILHDHYEILNLPFPNPTPSLSKQQLKLAYHKALLQHHPDKAPTTAQESALATKSTNDLTSSSSPRPTRTFTIDEITTAYKTLSDPALRAEYDRALRLDRSGREKTSSGAVFHTGLEVVDLEDLGFDEGEGDATPGQEGGPCWYRGCRCGDERGFLVTEDDLEREAEHGEIVIGCRGCSLWMKILFAVEDDEGEDGVKG